MIESPTGHKPMLSPHRGPAPARSGNAARLFGYDIFVSFALGAPPRGTRAYAADLARRLRELDLTVFFSEEEAPAGSQLDATLLRALLRSRVLVVVVNEGTLREPRWVQQEVEAFRSSRPGRLIVPIDIGGVLSDPVLSLSAADWLQHHGMIWVDESAQAARDGVVSDDVLARVSTAPRTVRARTKWRALVSAAFVGFAALAAVAWIQRNTAINELERATALRLVAESDAMLTGTRAGGDRRALAQLTAAAALSPSPEVMSALNAALRRHHNLDLIAELPGPITALLLHEAGGRLFAAVEKRGVVVLSWPGLSAGATPLLAPGETVNRLAISPDGQHLATAARISTPPNADSESWQYAARVQVWDLGSSKPVFGAVAIEGTHAQSLAFGARGRELLVAARAKVQRRDAVTGALLSAVELETQARLTSVLIHSKTGRVLTGGSFGPSSRELRLWDAGTGQPIGLPIANGSCDADVVTLDATGTRIVSAGGYVDIFDHAPCVFDAADGRRLSASIRPYDRPVTALSVSSDGLWLVSGSEGGDVFLWRMPSLGPTPLATAGQPHRAAVTAAAFDASRAVAVTAGADGTIRRWPPWLASRWEQDQLSRHAELQRGLLFTRDAALRVGDDSSGGWVGHADYFTDPYTGRAGGQRAHGDGGFSPCVGHSPDGRELIALERGKVRRWNAKTGTVIELAPQGVSERMTCVAYSPDGRLLAGSDSDGAVYLWDAATGRVHRTPIKAHDAAVDALRFTQDGRHLLTGARSGELRVWDTETGVATGRVMRVDARLTGADVTADGQTIAATYETVGLRWWDAATGLPLGSPEPRPNEAMGPVMFDARGEHVYVMVGRYGLKRWPSPARWLALLCDKLASGLSRDEWKQWVSPELPYREPCPP